MKAESWHEYGQKQIFEKQHLIQLKKTPPYLSKRIKPKMSQKNIKIYNNRNDVSFTRTKTGACLEKMITDFGTYG